MNSPNYCMTIDYWGKLLLHHLADGVEGLKGQDEECRELLCHFFESGEADLVAGTWTGCFAEYNLKELQQIMIGMVAMVRMCSGLCRDVIVMMIEEPLIRLVWQISYWKTLAQV